MQDEVEVKSEDQREVVAEESIQSSAQVDGNASVETSAEPTIEMDYAGFWARFFAYILDAIIIGIAGAIVMGLGYDMLITSSAEVIDWGRLLSSSIFTMVVTVVFWRYKSATPGKMMMGLSVVDATSGAAPTTGKLIVRYFAYIVSMLPLFLGYFWIAFDDRKQGFHDKIANTVVIVNPSADADEEEDAEDSA